MPNVSNPAVAAENAARREREKLKPEDIDSDWLDKLVTRLFGELDRQIKQVEGSRPANNDATTRASDARTLASLERTLERLARAERERASQRISKAVSTNGNALDEIERKITRSVEIEVSLARSTPVVRGASGDGKSGA
ncbi:MAG TPA: hypothetical protein VG309_09395 [Rhizomicrobium sp.]|jgi:hypothetical protein|nr:hypothetical protein [Rhizomicrobium sp.]